MPVLFIGALRARHLVADDLADGLDPHAAFIALATTPSDPVARADCSADPDRQFTRTDGPADGATAERGVKGHRTRFRLTNVALAELASSLPGVYVVDVAAALAAVGSERMLDAVGSAFTHFGSPGWMLQRRRAKRPPSTVSFPDVAPLAQMLGGDPYGNETVMAARHIDALVTVTGIGRKKCIILDLDGTLWPGSICGRDRQPLCVDPRSQRRLLLYRALFRPARSAAGAQEARHRLGLR